MKLKQGGLALVLSAVASTCLAATPASTQYVDAQFNEVKAQIAAIVPGVVHPVGSCYGGGVVYYRNPDANALAGQQGLIASLTDVGGTGTTYVWDKSNTNGGNGQAVTGTSNFLFMGGTNTTDIINTDNSTAAPQWPAADAATTFTTTTRCPTCTLWYLPSEGELNTMVLAYNLNNALFTTCFGVSPAIAYWSSSQANSNFASSLAISGGYVNYVTTDVQLGVRAVRAF